MSRAAYAARLAGLDPAALAAECARRIDYHRRMHGREQWREETRGSYGLCWAECCDRKRKDIWTAALGRVRQETVTLSRANAEALARLNPNRESEPDVANVNKVIFVGRLTRDPESRTFANGGAVAQFGFAVTNRKKNPSTGQWEDDPMFIDCKVFNRGENGQQANRVNDTLRKGAQVFLEGHLVLEQWEDKNGGGKRSKHVLVVDNFQYLEPRQDGGAAPSQARPSQTTRGASHPRQEPPRDPGDSYEPPDGDGGEIPF